MHLVTGKAGTAHITAENHRRLNAGAFGSGRYILNVGSLFAAQIATANTVTIADGVLMMDGAQVEIEPNSPETVTIESAAAGTYRRDVIAVEYSKDASGIETAGLIVVAGTSASTAAAAARPAAETGNIANGDTTARMALYEVLVEGVAIAECTLIAPIKFPAVDRLDALETKMQTAKAVADIVSGKWVIARKPTSSDIVSVNIPTIASKVQGEWITYKVTLPAGANSFIAIPFDGGWIGTNGFRFSTGSMTVSFIPINHASFTVSNGAFRFMLIYLKEVK